MQGALSDLTVVEYADFISGPFCAKLLADLGADVIKVEAPGGDRARRAGPFPGDVPHPERSGLFLYLNTNKRGVTLDVATAAGARLFTELVRQADILIENHPPSHLEGLGVGYDTLARENGRLVMTSITAFGQTGPYRDYTATNLVSMHMGSVGYYTPGAVDDPQREPPLKGGGHQAEFVTGLMGALESLGGIFLRDLTGTGQHIDLSTHEAVAFGLMRDLGSYTYDGILPGRAKGQVRVFGHFVPCADGYVQLYVTDDRQWRNFVDVMGNPDWARDERFANTLSRIAHAQILDEHIASWTKTQRKEDIYHAVQARHTACGPVNRMDEVLASPQLAARGYFTVVDHPDTGPLQYPGAPCALSRTPFRIDRPAPRLGEHNEEIFCGRLGVSRADLVRLRAAGSI